MQRGTEVEKDKASRREREVSEDRSFSSTKGYERILLRVEICNKGPTVKRTEMHKMGPHIALWSYLEFVPVCVSVFSVAYLLKVRFDVYNQK